MPAIEPRARAAAALTALVLLGACTADSPPDPPGAPAAQEQTQTDAARRPITKPDRLKVTNAALGSSRGHVRRAVRDLRAVGLWGRLTRDLYAVRFGSRPGRDGVPDDGHLADAYLTARIDGREGGSLCDVMFFPRAIRDDLERWRTYHGGGLLADPAPTERQFWAAIMAHELAHCLDGGRGERLAMRWERRALERLRAAGVE